MYAYVKKGTFIVTAQGRYPSWSIHNRLFPTPLDGWLTPARPEDVQTFQTQCDICRKEGAIQCSSAQNSLNKPAPVVSAS
jgi:hypothetical protein